MTSDLLARDAVPARPLSTTMWLGAGRLRGAVVARLPAGAWRRAEQGSLGPLELAVHPDGDRVRLEVHGPAGTPAEEAAGALDAARAWAGLTDDLTGFDELVGDHPVLSRLVRLMGPPVLGRLPRAAEAVGRAVLTQLVQSDVAVRTIAQLVAGLGTATPGGLHAWPTRAALGGAPAHDLRAWGIGARQARTLHCLALEEPVLEKAAAAQDWPGVDRLVRRIPGCRVWTSGEARGYLGDADAVSWGDYHAPAVVGWAIGERTETDEAMAELLAPFAPHRGRVVKLLERAARDGLVPVKPRRGPRLAPSPHRYW